MSSERWLVVTAARNEAEHLPALVSALSNQTVDLIARWVLVDDGSTDSTAEVARSVEAPFPVTVLERANTGGLAGASELAAFRLGTEEGLRQSPECTRVMKLDADLRLRPNYLEVLSGRPDTVGLVGGVIEGLSELAQHEHVRGGLRAYSRPALQAVADLPVALGWDVLDQVALRSKGFEVQVVAEATAATARRTGASVGIRQGRRRSGQVCRWTGYVPTYLLLKMVRVTVQRPFLVGLFWFVAGYVKAGRSPFPAWLLDTYRQDQRRRLRSLFRHPLQQGKAWYAR